MYFFALAADYDGTIAHDGAVDNATHDALEKLKESGRKLLLVTGRELPDLQRAFPRYTLFDRIVAENGAVIYDPESQEERVIGAAPSQRFVEALKRRRVEPLSVGRCIVATWEPHEGAVLEVIRDLGLELQIIFNKGAVMVLPAGINKAAGLAAALGELGLPAHNVVGVGDAENDWAFLQACGCSAAVANALPALKEAVDLVLRSERGAGVVELAKLMLHDDARLIPAARHSIAIGSDRSGKEIGIEPHKGAVLISGSSGIGKSTLATALTEKMADKAFEFCVFDPEGDYIGLEKAVSAGSIKIPPDEDEIMKLLADFGANTVVNTQALDVEERPAFFAKLFPQISSMRARTGRPHWLFIDEAHHVLPAARGGLRQFLPEEMNATILITVHPEAVSADALRTVKTVLALGPSAKEVIEKFCEAIGTGAPKQIPEWGEDEILLYRLSGDIVPVRPEEPRQVHKRHIRKYAEGELGADRSFYFRGPDNALNLRAQNLSLFNQIAAGIDDRTWEYHRKAGHYSAWFRNDIKNEALSREAAEIERDAALDAAESRKRIKDAISRRYTAPAKGACD